MQINRYIDHTILKPEATENDIVNLCREGLEYGFATVCINPVYISRAIKELGNSSVKVCAVIGFPLGANDPLAKAFESGLAMESGAAELDMVINIGALKSGEENKVAREIGAVVKVAENKALVKVIIEAGLLTDEEKIKVCKIAVEEGANFVKTSTGFNAGGATIEDVRLMRDVVGPGIGVKASGGIRDYQTAVKMIEAGADRIGTSAGVAIMKEFNKI